MDNNATDANPFSEIGLITSATDRLSPTPDPLSLNDPSHTQKPIRRDQPNLQIPLSYEISQQQRQFRRLDPQTPTQLYFNSDDLLASPNPNINAYTSNHMQTNRTTPELRRRLFLPHDPLTSAPNTAIKQMPFKRGTNSQLESFSSPQLPFQYRNESTLNFSPAFSPEQILPNPKNIPQPIADKTPTLLKSSVPNFPEIVVPQSNDSFAPLPPPMAIPFTPVTEYKAKCNCKASRCLKLYCPCFANSGFCAEGCTCRNCQNVRTTAHIVRDAREVVLARDPRAFEPKVRNTLANISGGEVYTKGCNCRKGCGKNYCVCRELGVDCGPRCTCSGPNGCLNRRPDGSQTEPKKLEMGNKVKKTAPISLRPTGNIGLQLVNTTQVKSQSVKRESKRLKREKSEPDPTFFECNILNGGNRSKNTAGPSVSPIEREKYQLLGGEAAGQSELVNITPFTPAFEVVKASRPTSLNRRVMNMSIGKEKSDSEAIANGTIFNVRPRTTNEIYPVKRRMSADREGCIPGNINTAPVAIKKESNLTNEVDDTRRRLFGEPSDANTLQKGEIMNDKQAVDEVRNEDYESAANDKMKVEDIEDEKISSEIEGTPRFVIKDRGEACRMPRILRVKMGSGRMLRKTGAR